MGPLSTLRLRLDQTLAWADEQRNDCHGHVAKSGDLLAKIECLKVFLLRFKCPKSLQISKPRNASQLKSPAFLQELEDCRRNLSTRVQILSVCRLANRVSFEVCWHLFARWTRSLLFFRCQVSWKQMKNRRMLMYRNQVTIFRSGPPADLGSCLDATSEAKP